MTTVTMSERLKSIVLEVTSAGYLLDKEALSYLQDLELEGRLELTGRDLVELAKCGPAKRDLFIGRDMIQNIAGTIVPPVSPPPMPAEPVRSRANPAEEIEASIQVVKDPSPEICSEGNIGDFAAYFRDRYVKLEKLLRQRLDARDAVRISDALSKPVNSKVRFIGMVLSRRQSSSNLMLELDDFDGSATVLVRREQNQRGFAQAQQIPLDQVICVEAVRSRGEMFVGENFILPDIPDEKSALPSDDVYAVLLSDIHAGSRTFLEEAFGRVVRWLQGDVGSPSELSISGRTKYVVVAGDLVDGVGVYPRQERELSLPDLYEQYRLVSKFIAGIPEHIEVIVAPGNHDAVRQALPQPAIPKDFAEPLYESRKLISLGNPAEVLLHGVRFLVFHGQGLDDLISSVPTLNFRSPEKGMKLQLRCRHLAPEFGRRTAIAPERFDHLVIEHPPAVFHSGHIHVVKCEAYRGSQIVNSGAWQTQTEYQKRLGIEPTPGILPVINLKNLHVTLLDFVNG